MTEQTYLIDFLEKTVLTNRVIGGHFATHLRSVVGTYSDFLRRHATVADLARAYAEPARAAGVLPDHLALFHEHRGPADVDRAVPDEEFGQLERRHSTSLLL